jgi:hypothetical protein
MTSSADFTWHDVDEDFRFVTAWFDIRKAKKIIRENPREVQQIDVTAAFNLIGDPPNPDGTPGRIVMGVSVYWDKALSDVTDLSIPIIVGELNTEWAEHLILDGYHRLAKAKAQGITMLPCVMLTRTEVETFSNLLTHEKERTRGKKSGK